MVHHHHLDLFTGFEVKDKTMKRRQLYTETLSFPFLSRSCCHCGLQLNASGG